MIVTAKLAFSMIEREQNAKKIFIIFTSISRERREGEIRNRVIESDLLLEHRIELFCLIAIWNIERMEICFPDNHDLRPI